MPTGGPVPDVPGRADGAPWTEVTGARRELDDGLVDRLAATIGTKPRGLLIAGSGAEVRPETAQRFAASSGVLMRPIFRAPIVRSASNRASAAASLLIASRSSAPV